MATSPIATPAQVAATPTVVTTPAGAPAWANAVTIDGQTGTALATPNQVAEVPTVVAIPLEQTANSTDLHADRVTPPDPVVMSRAQDSQAAYAAMPNAGIPGTYGNNPSAYIAEQPVAYNAAKDSQSYNATQDNGNIPGSYSNNPSAYTAPISVDQAYADQIASQEAAYPPMPNDGTAGVYGPSAAPPASSFASIAGSIASNPVVGLASNVLGTMLGHNPDVRDYQHASKLFIANHHELSAKHSFLYHVHFDVADVAKKLNGMNVSNKLIELGMLVKQVSLPKFTVDTKSLNAYNRPHLVQTKIHFDPVNITFHDDSADVVRNFWYDYYSYYYRTSDHGNADTLASMLAARGELTRPRLEKEKDWGYTIRGTTKGTLNKTPYLNAIRIYSLHNRRFSEYTLVNPIIKSFQHGEHNSASGGEILQHQMTIEYETVFYAYGDVSVNSVLGFATLHYDKTTSPNNKWPQPEGKQVVYLDSETPEPLPPSGTSATSAGGLLGGLGSIGSTLGGLGGTLGSISGALSGLGGFGGKLGALAGNLGGALGTASRAIALGQSISTSSANPFGAVNIPSVGGLLTSIGGSLPAGLSGISVNGISSMSGITSALSGIPGISSMTQTANSMISKVANNANMTSPDSAIAAAYADPSRKLEGFVPPMSTTAYGPEQFPPAFDPTTIGATVVPTTNNPSAYVAPVVPAAGAGGNNPSRYIASTLPQDLVPPSAAFNIGTVPSTASDFSVRTPTPVTPTDPGMVGVG